MEQFETAYTITADTYKEMKWHLLPSRDKIIISLTVVIGIAVIFSGIQDQHAGAIFFGIALIIAFTTIGFWIPHQITNVNLRRTLETIGTTNLQLQSSFTDSGIKLHNLQTNGTSTTAYGHVRKFAETKHMYILFTGANHFIIVNKATLAQAGETEAFLQFIKSKLPHVKIKRP